MMYVVGLKANLINIIQIYDNCLVQCSPRTNAKSRMSEGSVFLLD